MFIIFKLFNIKQLHSLLIPFYQADQKAKEQVLDLGVRLGASVLFTFTQMNFIESILPTILQEYYSGFEQGKGIDIAYKALDVEASKIILSKSTDIKQILPLKKLENANGALSNKASVILKFIELYFHNNSAVVTIPKKQRITVEHILSKEVSFDKDISDAGFLSVEDFNNHKNLIGNLTLLFNNENASAGNKKFEDKIKLYSDQDFIITQSIAKDLISTTKGGKNTKFVNLVNEKETKYVPNPKGHFDKDAIKDRSSKMADLIYDLVNKNIRAHELQSSF
ncbi:HNH endonuclease family protein [Bacillus sp. WL1]|nr:HNH endonuclease family protein [Bacillus sp. WL1]